MILTHHAKARMRERGITNKQVEDTIKRGKEIEHRGVRRRKCFLRNDIFVIYIPSERVVVTVMDLKEEEQYGRTTK